MAEQSTPQVKDLLVNVNTSADTSGFSKVSKSAKDLEKDLINISKVLSSLEKDSKESSNVLNKLNSTFKMLSSGLKGVAYSLSGINIGFKSGVSFARSYNQELLRTATVFAKYGDGITKVEDKIDSLSKRLGINRAETMRLFKSYQSGFNLSTLSGAEKIFENIHKITGANSDAISELISKVQDLTNSYPELVSSVENYKLTNVSELSFQNIGTLRLNDKNVEFTYFDIIEDEIYNRILNLTGSYFNQDKSE
jgi:hypothetical protein